MISMTQNNNFIHIHQMIINESDISQYNYYDMFYYNNETATMNANQNMVCEMDSNFTYNCWRIVNIYKTEPKIKHLQWQLLSICTKIKCFTQREFSQIISHMFALCSIKNK